MCLKMNSCISRDELKNDIEPIYSACPGTSCAPARKVPKIILDMVPIIPYSKKSKENVWK